MLPRVYAEPVDGSERRSESAEGCIEVEDVHLFVASQPWATEPLSLAPQVKSPVVNVQNVY
jgi:type II secretory pathway component HofQ